MRSGKMPTTSVRRRISLLSRSWGLLDQIWRQICLGKAVNASSSARAASRCSATLGSLSAQCVENPIILGDNRFSVGLVEDGVQQGAHPRPGGFRGDRHQVDRVMSSAALPGRPGQGGPDRGHQPGVGIAGDQRDPGQAAGDQVAEERQPARPVLGGGDLDAQDFSVALGVDAGGDQGVHPDDAAVLADLEHQRVGGHERVRAGVERAGAKRLDGLVELGGHD